MCNATKRIRPLSTVDLDGLLDLTARFRQVKQPLWVMTDHVDWLIAHHGGEPEFLMEADGWRALRPWTSFGVLAEEAGSGLSAARICRSIPAGKRRAYTRIPASYAFHDEHIDRQRNRAKHVVAHYPEMGWCVVGCEGNRLARPVKRAGEDEQAALLFGGLLWSEYVWGARFLIPGHAPFVIPTDGRGALALFRLRDKPDEGGRRPSLRHWVSEHFRRVPSGDHAGVRTHLRGTERFHWSGISVELRPSAFDLERAASAQRPIPASSGPRGSCASGPGYGTDRLGQLDTFDGRWRMP